MMGHAVVNSKPASPITPADTATTLKQVAKRSTSKKTPAKTVTFGHGEPPAATVPWLNSSGLFIKLDKKVAKATLSASDWNAYKVAYRANQDASAKEAETE